MEKNEEKYSLCALNKIFGFEPKIAHALISHLGSAYEVFRMSDKDKDLLLGPHSKFRHHLNMRSFDDAAAELDKLSQNNTTFIGCTDEGYPGLLLECEDHPLGLYIRSSTPPKGIFDERRRVAVVGTRDLSPYGSEWCQRIVQGLAYSDEKPVIVSGLALGTDICAHAAAVEAGLPTIGVMATGPEQVYPYRHRNFAEKMVETPGCALVTDYPPGTAPLAIHFLRRNRIIAGLSDATVLIESRIKGGGMMTSRLAFSYNRDVYALPGRVDDIRSQGCNLLIRSKIAEAIDSVEGMTESMGLTLQKRRGNSSIEDLLRNTFNNTLSKETLSEMSLLLYTIRKFRGINLDDLCARCGLSYQTTAELAGILETEGIISIDLLQRCFINIRFSR